MLDLADGRAHRWRQRLRDTGSLEDRDPGGGAVDGLLSWKEAGILALIEEWGQIDRWHRKIAHRGSRLGVVFVSPSTVLRVALKHNVQLLGEPDRPRRKPPVLPEIPWAATFDLHLISDRLGRRAPRTATAEPVPECVRGRASS